MWPAALLLAAYLSGSIPFGLLIARARGIDIRSKGSGNIGATNVWRVMGWRFGLPCFILDVLKGLIPSLACVWLIGALGTPARLELTLTQAALLQLAVALAAILGHMFPVWLGFKGGKGVATAFGSLLGTWPVFTLATIAALAVWLVSVKITKMVGISSCIAALAFVALIAAEAFSPPELTRSVLHRPPQATWIHAAFAAALAALVIFRHRSNIARMIAGTENRVGNAGTQRAQR